MFTLTGLRSSIILALLSYFGCMFGIIAVYVGRFPDRRGSVVKPVPFSFVCPLVRFFFFLLLFFASFFLLGSTAVLRRRPVCRCIDPVSTIFCCVFPVDPVS